MVDDDEEIEPPVPLNARVGPLVGEARRDVLLELGVGREREVLVEEEPIHEGVSIIIRTGYLQPPAQVVVVEDLFVDRVIVDALHEVDFNERSLNVAAQPEEPVGLA